MKPNLEHRRALLRLIERFPGLHLRELSRAARLSEALAGYHLAALEAEGHVRSAVDGEFRRFYSLLPTAPRTDDEPLIGLLRQRVPLQVAVFLQDRERATQTELAETLGLAKSTVSYHVGKLRDVGFLRLSTGSEAVELAEPARVRALLLRWQPRSDVTDRFASLWNAFFRTRKPRE